MNTRIESVRASSLWQWMTLGMKASGLVALVVVVVVAVNAWWESERPVTFKLSFGEGKTLTIEVPREGLSSAEMVRQLMSDDTEERKKIRNDVLALLASNHGIHELNDPKTVRYIRGLGYEEPFMVELRRAFISGERNMWPKEHLVVLNHSDEVPVSRAAVCKGSEFIDNRISLFHGEAGSPVWLVASLPFENEGCKDNPNKWIQVNPADGGRLDDKTHGVTAKVEPVLYALSPSGLPVTMVELGSATLTQEEN